MGYLDCTIVCPTPTITPTDSTIAAPNPAYDEWIRKDQRVISWMISFLSPDVLPYVVGSISAADVSKALQTAFGSLSYTSILQLHMQLQNTSKGDKFVLTYLREVKYISDQLAAANRPLENEELNAIVFRNLGSDFSDIVTVLATKPDPITFPELHRLLLNRELRMKSATVPIEANVTAYTPL
ncbi:uncharacterized protein LOC125314072 [Rhodamnia argentea]|uniref:Uncharacterized protein LOC125314072 n=1 Tax=Rhodamnia argentea TaxID=178133 RepID=A0ABM3H4H0_9MYRT|nr:uncharacterized protein LOC125314072 [Rhodamnia argentea]